MDSKGLAIVIPFYKRKYFRETLESLKNQTDKNFTVYIGNDGSKDEVIDLIKEYKPYFNLKYKVFPHIGYKHLSRHWQRCIAMTTGEEWFQVLGDDDVLASNFVEKINCLISNKEELIDINLISARRKVIDKNGETLPSKHPTLSCGLYNSKKFFMDRILGRRNITLSEQVFSMKAYQKYGLQDFPVAFGTDDVAFLKYTEMGEFYYCDKTYVKIRISPEHLSSTTDEDVHINRIKGLKESRKYILKEFSERLNSKEKTILLSHMLRIERSRFKILGTFDLAYVRIILLALFR